MNQAASSFSSSGRQPMDVDQANDDELKELLADIRATKTKIANLEKEFTASGVQISDYSKNEYFMSLNRQLEADKQRLASAGGAAGARGAAPIQLGPDGLGSPPLQHLFQLATHGLPQHLPIYGDYDNGKGIYVRECYPDMVQALLRCSKRRVLVSGTPGTGKSVFALYFLDYLIRNMATLNPKPESIIYHNVQFHHEVLFRDGKVYVALIKDEAFLNQYPRSYFLFDSGYGLEPKLEVGTKLFVFASPRESNRNEFQKNSVDKIFMPLWDLEEVIACAKQCFSVIDHQSVPVPAAIGLPAVRQFTTAELTAAYAKHGGVPRTLLKQDDADLNLEEILKTLDDVDALFKNMLGVVKITDDPQASQRILHILVDRQTFQRQRVCIASPYIAEVLGVKYVLQCISKAQSFMFGAGGNPETAALRGDLFEGYVHHLMQPGLRLEGRRLVTKKELNAHRKKTADPKSHPNSIEVIDVFELAQRLAPSVTRTSGGAATAKRQRTATVTLVPPAIDLPHVAGVPVKPFVAYQVFTELVQILDMSGQYARPAWRNLAAVDSLLVPLLWFQMTVSLHHPISQSGLNDLFNLLEMEKGVKFFFVVPDSIFDDFCIQSYYLHKDQVADSEAKQDDDEDDEIGPGPVKNSRTSQKRALEDIKLGKLEQWALRVSLAPPRVPPSLILGSHIANISTSAGAGADVDMQAVDDENVADMEQDDPSALLGSSSTLKSSKRKVSSQSQSGDSKS